MKLLPSQKKILAFLIIIVLVSGCARNHQFINGQASSQETELGDIIHRQILQTVPIYPEQTLNDYIQNVGHRIASNADRKGLIYRFIILEDDRVYATFAPGGYIYITTGFFSFLQSEIELAGTLAYEIAALQYKDPRLSHLKKSFDFILMTGSYVAPAFGAIGALSVIGLALVGAATSGEKSRLKRIEEADAKALRYLSESGYDPQGLINLLFRMNDPTSPYRAYLYDYLQSHPIDFVRLAKLDEEFQKLPMENKHFDAGRDSFLIKTEIVRNTFAKK